MQIAAFLEETPSAPDCWPTGLKGLDELLRGVCRRQLWVITGAPMSGKSMLLIQLVYALAVTHGLATEYVGSSVDSAALTRARFLSLALNRAPDLPGQVVPLDALTPKQQIALDRLRAAPLDVVMGTGWGMPRWSSGPGGTQCMAVDDPEGKRPPVLDAVAMADLRRFADQGGVVLVTVPRSLCIERSEKGCVLREEWAASADVILEVVRGTGSGDASLKVRQNRHGPSRDVPVVALDHWSRFADSSPS